MNSYFFPCLALIPKFDGSTLEFRQIKIHKRLWDTSIFDLATLATKHTLHLSYQLMDLYLKSCNLEIEIIGDGDREAIIDEMQIIRAILYLHGFAPFMIPFFTTHSINDYSGINSRDSDSLRDKLAEGMKTGLKSDEGTLEAWYCDRTWTLIRDAGAIEITDKTFAAVAIQLDEWKRIERGLSGCKYRPTAVQLRANDPR